MGITCGAHYPDLWLELKQHAVDFHSRSGSIFAEIIGFSKKYSIVNGPSISSSIKHRVFPIKFALAELAWILSGRDDLDSIQSYCKAMSHFSDDAVTLHGAYGARLSNQWIPLVELLRLDMLSRRAVVQIYNHRDLGFNTSDVPCNCLLQFTCRDNSVTTLVYARSSDFITGFPIDLFHWQAVSWMLAYELGCNSASTLVSTVGSLHVYECDKMVTSRWECNIEKNEYIIPFCGKLLDVINSCKKDFRAGLSIAELCDLLQVPDQLVCVELNDIFKRREQSVNR